MPGLKFDFALLQNTFAAGQASQLGDALWWPTGVQRRGRSTPIISIFSIKTTSDKKSKNCGTLFYILVRVVVPLGTSVDSYKQIRSE